MTHDRVCGVSFLIAIVIVVAVAMFIGIVVLAGRRPLFQAS